MRHHRYWSSSKFANWLRGNKMPASATSEGWDNFHNMAKIEHPFRYWLSETFLTNIENTIYWPSDKFNSITNYAINRWITKTNGLIAHKDDIRPGCFQELSDMILPCVFNGLVDHVEVSLAWMTLCGSEDAASKHGIHWTMTTFPFRLFNPLRSESAGLSNLAWSSNLIVDESYGIEPGDPSYGKTTAQAESAKEILVLYHWWKARKNRPDAMESTGWVDFCERRRTERTPEMNDEARVLVQKLNDLETKYEQEDTDMLIRLIKIRTHLWT